MARHQSFECEYCHGIVDAMDIPIVITLSVGVVPSMQNRHYDIEKTNLHPYLKRLMHPENDEVPRDDICWNCFQQIFLSDVAHPDTGKTDDEIRKDIQKKKHTRRSHGHS